MQAFVTVTWVIYIFLIITVKSGVWTQAVFLGSMKTRRAVTIFHFWYKKMIFSFLFYYGSCSRLRSRSKRSARAQTKIFSCFWLLQTTHMEEMKARSTGTPVQLTPLILCSRSQKTA